MPSTASMLGGPLPSRSLALLAALIPASCIGRSAPATPAVASGGAPTASSGADGRSGDSLRDAAARAHRFIGTAVATYHFGDPGYARATARDFDSLTAENEMKWGATEPRPGVFHLEAGDAIVAFATQHGMRVRGHTLVWHNQLAPWAKELSGDDLHAAMIRHVRGVAGHFKGRIAQWDVVNEAVGEGESVALRESSPFTALGATYIDDAFRAAHEADPEALLFYNDYDIEAPGAPKSEAAYALVKRLKESGVPIHGVGFQMHVDPRHWPNGAEIRQTLERFAALGLAIEITEMDVPIGEIPGTHEEKLERQKAITVEIVRACVAVPQCTGITVWGVTDKYSWLATPEWGRLRGRLPHDPLPLDANYEPKPMYWGIVKGFASK